MPDNEFPKERSRSPAYPFFGLREAVDYIKRFYQKYGSSRVQATDALDLIGYSITSGSGARALSVFFQFGLFEFDGIRDERRVWLSQLGEEILTSVANTIPIQRAALLPEMHLWLWEQFALDRRPLPSDNALLQALISDGGFSEKAAIALVKEFRDTYEYARLNEYAKDQASNIQRAIEIPMSTPHNVQTEVEYQSEDRDFPVQLTRGNWAKINLPPKLRRRDFELINGFLEWLKTVDLYDDVDDDS